MMGARHWRIGSTLIDLSRREDLTNGQQARVASEALRALDADRVEGRVGLRLSVEGEAFEGRVSPLPDGTIVVADEKRPLGVLFDRTAKGRGVVRGTSRVLLVAIVPLSVALEVVFTMFALFVAFIQAVIFAFLSTIYINDALHPGH